MYHYEQSFFIFIIQLFNNNEYGTRKNQTDSRARSTLVIFAPKFAELNDDVLFRRNLEPH